MRWLQAVLGLDDIAEALAHASPVLAAKVRVLCEADEPDPRETRRAVLAVARYLVRMSGRPTPFGLFAGVAAVSFAAEARHVWGDGPRAVASAGADWLVAVIARLEGCPEMLARVDVVANSTLLVRGARLVVPYQAGGERGAGAVEVSLRHTAVVRAAVQWAGTPIRVGDLVAKLHAGFPAASPDRLTMLVAELVVRRVLITGLHAPSTVSDPLKHLLAQLDRADTNDMPEVAGLIVQLREVHSGLARHNAASLGEARAERAALARRMRAVAATAAHPLAVDLRLTATTVLPDAVAREVERTALLLTRLSAHPTGTRAWRDYHQRFYERFGIGSLVPVLDVVADSGIGWPDGYPNTTTGERRSPMSHRDELLLDLAQRAALDGATEVVLDEELVAGLELRPDRPARLPAHLELTVRIHATSAETLTGGAFQLEIGTVSRAAGVLTGRFLHMLEPPDATRLAAGLAALPAADADTVAAQLSFPPLQTAAAHVTRSPQVMPLLITLAEHRDHGGQVLTVHDLAVGCDGRRMYLAAPALGKRIEAVGMHALNLRRHTPPLARFLTEASRGQHAQVTTFAWGAAAELPYLPRLRSGRVVLAPARWRLAAPELPTGSAPFEVWRQALAGWRDRRRVPRHIQLGDSDKRLPLDLDHTGHQILLRDHLAKQPVAVLTEAPTPEAYGWCGGRAHEVVLTVTATNPPAWPALPAPCPARVTGRGEPQPPAASGVLLASLYGDVHRQDLLLAEHLPRLLTLLGEPRCWFIRFRDPDHHLRLRIALADPAGFGPTAAIVSRWAGELHRAGLLREVRYPTSYPETGRWGSGPAYAAVEDVFRADSRAVLTQLSQHRRPGRQALAAAHTVGIAAAFTGSTAAGMRWLTEHLPAAAPAKIPRPVLTEAVRLADPRNDWAALRAAPGGAAITATWPARAAAIAAYRKHLTGRHTDGHDTAGIDVDDVLTSMLHAHYVRACGIDFDDEAVVHYLARAAALAWTARTGSSE